MKIRDFQDSDAEQVCEIIRRCDKEISSRDYPPEIIEWRVSKLKPEYIIAKSKNKKCLVAVLNKKVVGYISLDNDEIKKLHVNPEYHHMGIGKKLLQEIEKFAVKNKISKLVVESSIYAEKFYEKFGFKKIEIRDCEYKGTKFKLIFMEKKLK
jgi:ribosomal protein S18 acetylase RimI-like enzyme